ncbi:MAG TPA: 30S ribosomal protein S6 [Candidatus Nanoarchaeia archaeon]|nr:30S ribosomal protein S6 [Candidatus Nanoarchaeia archaeon]
MKATENKTTGEKMHVYEVGYLIMPTVAEDNLTQEVSWLNDMITSHKGEIISEEFPKLRSLVYTMEKVLESKHQKINEAYFGWVKFELPVAAIKPITQALDTRPTILRHLVIKTVRENTLYGSKLAAEARKAEGEESTEEKAPKVEETLVN